MLYMVGKVFLHEISFNLVYNESGHKNMKKFEYLLFHRGQENISIILKQMEGMKQHCVFIHTHICIK